MNYKKRIALIALVLIFSLSLAGTALAEESERTTRLVSTNTELLTDADWTRLNELAEEISVFYECDTAVLLLAEGDKSEVGRDILTYATDLYSHFNYGYGSEKSGVLLLIDSSTLEYAVVSGGYGDTAFTAYGKEQLAQSFSPYLQSGLFGLAVESFLIGCDEYLELAYIDQPVDVPDVSPAPEAPAVPEISTGVDETGMPLDFVFDSAGLLTPEQVTDLDEKAWLVSSKHDFPVLIITVPTASGIVPAELAETIYDSLGVGTGDDRDGVLLFVNIGERDVVLFTRGYGNTVFTDFGKEILEREYISDLSAGDFHAAFAAYIAGCDNFLKLAAAGKPIDVDNYKSDGEKLVRLVLGILIPLGISFVFCSIMANKMKTAVLQRAAQEYIPQGGFQLLKSDDVYSHTTEVRTKIQRSSGGGSSGGGTTRSSSGSSSRSSKF